MIVGRGLDTDQSMADIYQKERVFHPDLMEYPYNSKITGLNHSYIYCSRAFLALFNIKCNPVAFIESLETGCIDS